MEKTKDFLSKANATKKAVRKEDFERVRRTDGEEEGSGAVEEDLYKTVARNCFPVFWLHVILNRWIS